MEYLVTCSSHEHLLRTLEKEIDGFVIGERFLSLNLPYTYTRAQLLEMISTIRAHGKKVYVDMRTLLPNEVLPRVSMLLTSLNETDVTGVIFADPAVFMIAQDLQLTVPLVWGADTISTNWYMNDFWAEKGIKHTLIAKELTKEAIRSIDENIQQHDLVFELQGFGPLTMFHSRRQLLDNYYQYLEQVKVDKMNTETDLFLYDNERNNYYPIVEDFNGTHIFSPNDISLIDEFDFLMNLNHLQFLKLDAKGHDAVFMDKVFDLFIEARNLYEEDNASYKKQKSQFVSELRSLYATDKRTIDKGFLYKPTIY